MIYTYDDNTDRLRRMEQFRSRYVRDDNTRWIPRDAYADRIAARDLYLMEAGRELRRGVRSAIIITIALAMLAMLVWGGA